MLQPCIPLQVAVRVRPPNAQELARGDAQALFVNPGDHRQLQLAVPAGYSRSGSPTTRNFAFHACLSPASRQQVNLRGRACVLACAGCAG